MDDDTRNYLKRLQDTTTEICKGAFDKRNEEFKYEAINWADLWCYHAEKHIAADGEEGYRVYIEEASPGCDKFRIYIANELAKLGFANVGVVTEW